MQAQRGLVMPAITVLSRDPEHFLSRNPEFRGHSWLSFRQGDILVPCSLPSNVGFTHVLHAAADSTQGPTLSPLERYDQIVNGTRHLLDWTVAQGIKRFLFVSSGGVYGSQPIDMARMPEDHMGSPDPMDAGHAYSIAKRCAEHLCAMYGSAHGLEIVIARCFAFVGRDLPLNAHFAIGNFILDALSRPEILVRGDGSPMRSYMDQRDLASWLSTLLERGRAGQAYNVGSDIEISISDLATLVRDVLSPMKRVTIAADSMAPSFRNRYVPSVDKAREEFGLEVRHQLIDAIREAARHASKRGT